MGAAEVIASCFLCCGGFIVIVTFFALALADLVFAIAGSVILAQTNEIIHGPWNMWIYVLVQVIICYILALGLARDHYTKEEFDQNGQKKQVTISQTSGIFILAALGIAIWGMVIYYNIDKESADMYYSLYPQLITFVRAITAYFIILWSILGVFIVIALLGLCCGGTTIKFNREIPYTSYA